MSTLSGSTPRSIISVAASAAALLLVTACSGGSLPTSAIPNVSAAGAGAQAATLPHAGAPSSFQFTTLDDQADPTFNQLLGINDRGKIAGYFGIGSSSHPNKGYTLKKPYGQNDYMNENFPNSVQTQVTSINDDGDTAGFWIDSNNVARGFIEWHGVFTSYMDPKTHGGTVNQILGINNSGEAVGFYTDSMNVNHGFTLNQATGKFTAVTPPGGGSVQVTGINAVGDITGLVANSSGTTGFIRKGRHFSAFSFPGGSNTQAFGINNADQIVGSYLDGSQVMHGFLLSQPLTHAQWTSIDDPNGIGSTVVNGLNNKGDMVGFYTDSANNVDGMLITP